jgi:hypothetical protein
MCGHARIGLDGVHVIPPAKEGPSQLTGATADLEHAASWMQPRAACHGIHKPRRVTRAGAVVLGRSRAEHQSASAAHHVPLPTIGHLPCRCDFTRNTSACGLNSFVT